MIQAEFLAKLQAVRDAVVYMRAKLQAGHDHPTPPPVPSGETSPEIDAMLAALEAEVAGATALVPETPVTP